MARVRVVLRLVELELRQRKTEATNVVLTKVVLVPDLNVQRLGNVCSMAKEDNDGGQTRKGKKM